MAARLPTMLTAMLVVVMLAPTAVRADGDPASDVLLNQNVFAPYSPPVSPAILSTLNAETATATDTPIKVALIASPADLGSVPDLFGKPQPYADFLEQEISSLQGQQRLLVVMAAGYGVQGVSAPARRAVASLQKPASGQSNELARAAMAAVAKIAAASGHPIATPAAASAGTVAGSGRGGGSGTLIVAIVAVAALAAALLITLRRRGSGRHAR